METFDRGLVVFSVMIFACFLAYVWLDNIENRDYEAQISQYRQTIVSQQETIVDLHSEIRELKANRE